MILAIGQPRRSQPLIAAPSLPICLKANFLAMKPGPLQGAVNKKIGFFQHANKGTIFLDEIINLPLAMQAKLLRVLQERQITPVGANKTVDVDIRLVSATNEMIDRAIKEERFRADLYYRVNTIELICAAIA